MWTLVLVTFAVVALVGFIVGMVHYNAAEKLRKKEMARRQHAKRVVELLFDNILKGSGLSVFVMFEEENPLFIVSDKHGRVAMLKIDWSLLPDAAAYALVRQLIE